jgi:hypothetical protein
MREEIRELADLIIKHPDLEIICMTWNEVVAADEGYWESKIGDIAIVSVWSHVDEIVFGEHNILEKIRFNLSEDPESLNLSTKDFEKKVEGHFNDLMADEEIKNKIVIYIELP